MVRTYCGEALPKQHASLLRQPKPFLFSFLRDTETTGDNFDELLGHYFVIKKVDHAPSACLAHAPTQLFIFHQPEQGFGDVVNIRDIAKALLRLMKDEQLRRRMGEAGRRRVVDLFNYKVVAKKFVEIISRRLGIS